MEQSRPIEMLKKDHRKVEDLFLDFGRTDKDDYDNRKSIVDDVCFNLKLHADIEEEVFYPEVEKVSGEGMNLISESRKEHEKMKNYISELEKMNADDAEYDSRFEMLKEETLHHVKEEESKVFPFAEANMKEKLDTGMVAKIVAYKGKDLVKEMI